MKNSLSILITLAILLSGSNMASVDSMLEQFAKLEISATNSNIGDRSGTCSHLDALIANNKAIPEAWLPQPCCEHEDRLKKEMGIINKQDLKDYLSQFEDCEDVADKLFILKDHEYYHYILFQTVMGLRRHCSTNELGISYHSIDKDAEGLQTCGNIIQETIKSLTLEDRPFEERPYSISKYSSVSSIKVGCRGKELELEPLQSNYSNLCKTDKTSENSVRSSILLYMSKGRERNLNCEVCRNGELVKCRHLAAWWLKLKEFEYGDIDSKEKIARCKKILSSAELNERFHYKVYPSEGVYFEISKFHNVICDVAISLSEGQEKRYLVGSVVHVMGLCIKKNKYNNIIIYYYDPNDTLRHKEIIANTAEDLKCLNSYDFWNPKDQHLYFPGRDAVGCLLSLDTKPLQNDCKVVCTNKPSANLMYLLSYYGHCGHPAACFDLNRLGKCTKKEFIAAKQKNGTSALYIACQTRHLEAVSALIAMIINIDLDVDVKKELLAGRLKDGTSPLFIVCQKGDHAIAIVLITGIFSGDLNLSNGEKAELLAGKRNDGCPILHMACNNGHTETVTVLIAAICKGDLNLNHAQKLELLAGKSSSGYSALHVACYQGHHKVVIAFMAEICRGDLNWNNDEKAELLAGKDANGCPALYIACENGHPETVTALIAAICSHDLNLTSTEKVELLAGKNASGCSALYIACQNGHTETVTALIAAICKGDLNLNHAQKVELLAGKNASGCSALYKACENGHPETVTALFTALFTAICNGDIKLSHAQKTELLAGKNKNGCSALHIVCENGHPKTVTALIAAICSYDLNLTNTEKAELLAGKNENGCSALYIACENGHPETVTALMVAICRGNINFNNDGNTEFSAGENTYCFSVFISAIRKYSRKLSKNQKEELLAGKNEEGCPALYIACQNGYRDVVTAFVSAICSSDLSLSKSEKAKLLAGKCADGVSALERAHELGYYEIVEVLRGCLR